MSHHVGRLVIYLGSLPVLGFQVDDGEIRLGRALENDIVLTLPEIAEEHAMIRTENGKASIVAALGESVVINGNSVERAELHPDAPVTIGGYRLRWFPADADATLGAASKSDVPTRPLQKIELPALNSKGRIDVIAGIDSGRSVILGSPGVVVGRAPECDLVLNDDSVSWRHVSLELVRDGIRLTDLGSRNGTFLGRRRIESAMAEPRDAVRVGETTLRLVPPESTFVDPTDDPESELPGGGLAEFVGRSLRMRVVYSRVRQAAANQLPVLIVGERGTGKNLTARAIHSLGATSAGPFVSVNCSAMPESELEIELFGGTQDSPVDFGAIGRACLERAIGGTLFLDDIGGLPPRLQSRLLTAIERDGIHHLIGGGIQGGIRLLAATNRNIGAEGGASHFLLDLYHRLAVLRIELPPLRDRLDDIEQLCATFLNRAESESGIRGARELNFDEFAIERLRRHRWSGNVRELERVVLRCAAEAEDRSIGLVRVEQVLGTSFDEEVRDEPKSLADTEREAIRKTLQDCRGQRRAAARRLGISESTLYVKIKRFGLESEGLE